MNLLSLCSFHQTCAITSCLYGLPVISCCLYGLPFLSYYIIMVYLSLKWSIGLLWSTCQLLQSPIYLFPIAVCVVYLSPLPVTLVCVSVHWSVCHLCLSPWSVCVHWSVCHPLPVTVVCVSVHWSVCHPLPVTLVCVCPLVCVSPSACLCHYRACHVVGCSVHKAAFYIGSVCQG